MQQRRTQRALIACTMACTFSSLLLGATATNDVQCTGIEVTEPRTTTSDGLYAISMAGGAIGLVSGQALQDTISANILSLSTDMQTAYYTTADGSTVGTQAINKVLPALNEDDTFLSNPKNGVITQTVPAVTDLYGVGYSQMDGFTRADCYYYSCEWQLSITDATNTANTITCSGNTGRVKYDRMATPLLFSVTPRDVVPGQKIQMNTYLRQVYNDVPTDEIIIKEMNLDRTHMNTEDTITETTRPWKWGLQYVKGFIPDDTNAISDAAPSLLFVKGYARLMKQARTCNFAGDDCYTVRVHPQIKTVTTNTVAMNQGWNTGNQEMTITGLALNGTNAVVTVDGVDCQVISNSETQIICMTWPKGAVEDSATAVSVLGLQPGSPGIVGTTVDSTDWTEIATGSTSTRTDTHYTSLEIQRDTLYYDGVFFKGFFAVPAGGDGDYRFKMTCDDECKMNFHMSDTTHADWATQVGDSTYRDNMVEIATATYRSGFRNYWSDKDVAYGSKPVSDYITLVGGQYHYFEVLFKESGGSDYLNVGVEFKGATDPSATHPQLGRTVQKFEILNPGQKEEWKVEVTYVDDKEYKLNFMNPWNSPPTPWQSSAIKADASAADFKSAISGYYSGDDDQGRWGSSITVTLRLLDPLGIETAEPMLQVKREYTIQLDKMISGDYGITSATITAVVVDTTATIVTTTPEENLKTSDAPIGGKYTISCLDPTMSSTAFVSGEIDPISDTSIASIHNKLGSVPMLGDNMWLYESSSSDVYHQNGYSLVIDFHDYDKEPPLCTIQSGTVTVMTGGPGLAFNSEVLSEYGKTLWWDSVPLEMLRTAREMPQVEVSVNGIKALCTESNCDYKYIAPVGVVTEVTYSKVTNTIGVFGTLPTDYQAKIEWINADASCNSNGGFNYMSCVFEAPNAPWDMTETGITSLTGPYGRILTTAATNACADCYNDNTMKITAVTVAGLDSLSTASKNGGVVLTITGEGFKPLVRDYKSINRVSPWITETRTVAEQSVEAKPNLVQTVTDKDPCVITSATKTQIVCEFASFSGSAGTVETVEVWSEDGSQQATWDGISPTTITLQAANTNTALSVVPAVLSPVQKTTVVITMATDFVGSILANKDEIYVNLIGTSVVWNGETTAKTTAAMYVAETSETDKTITIKYPGAPSTAASYRFEVGSTTAGRFDSSALTVTVKGEVTSISRQTGSIYGGTTITIGGGPFSTDPLDNPVQIGTDDCIVSSSTTTEIVCQLGALTGKTSADTPVDIKVFLKLAEEATCAVVPDCKYAYIDPDTTITAPGTVVTWDDDNDQYKLELTGITTVGRLFLDGLEQTTKDGVAPATWIVTSLVNSVVAAPLFIDEYGTIDPTENAKLAVTVNPYLTKVEPAVGSFGGTLVTVTGAGFSSSMSLMLVNLSDDSDLCTTVTVLSYTQFTCQVAPGEIAETNTAIKGFACDQADGAATPRCIAGYTFSQLEASSPTIISMTLSDADTIAIVGTNFKSGLRDSLITVEGVQTTCSEISADNLSCVFPPGTMPWTVAGATQNYPDLVFYSKTDTARAWPIVPANVNLVTYSNDFLGFSSMTSLDNEVVIGNGETYAGFQVTTRTGKTCGAWTDTSVHEHTQTAVGSHNYCRNPDGSQTIWCYTTDSATRFDYCDPIVTSCSYGGGCEYSMEGTNLITPFNQALATVSICDVPCIFDATASTSSISKCTVPAMPTITSINAFQLISPALLPITYTGTASSYTTLNDNDNTNEHTDSSAACTFGFSAPTGKVYVLDVIQVFLNGLRTEADRAKIVSLLVFQGSDDGLTWEDLYTFGDEIHAGWNNHQFDSSSRPSKNMFRFSGTGVGSCRVAEVKITGVQAGNDAQADYTCTPVLKFPGLADKNLNMVKYETALTPLITAITPRLGDEYGGTTVTITGTGFSLTSSENTVTIDGVVCTPVTATATEITCTTQARDGSYALDPSISIFTVGKGNASTAGFVYRYVALWSNFRSWADFLPIEGDSVSIPKGRHIQMDVDSTPILNTIIVEGSLIFAPNADPNHHRTFDARIILCNGGYIEMGTEAFPYTSKLTVTMHGAKYDPTVPIYGQKVIGIRYGILEMHGNPRANDRVWTELKETADVAATTITLNEAVDWVAGEKIVIASTDFEGRNAEKRTIVSVDNTDPLFPIVTLDSALVYKHYAAVETYGTDTITMRAEVGLLSRNVVFRGDPATSAQNQFGAHIMLHSPGDESIEGRIENCEFTDVGQAFQLGRYPIHFHMVGTVHASYVRNNAVHQTYNRAVTIHGVHYFKVINNVAYDTMGHTIFIEDAAETNCLIQNNLIIQTKRSWSLLNTDQTPASFWITHPNNDIRDNRAAGSDRYGFWYDTQKTAMGPSYDPGVCPEGAKLGRFDGNVAHSNGRYGLRIFHKHMPLEKMCAAYDATTNPIVPGIYQNFLGYKNGRAGAIAEEVGGISFENFKVIDNVLSGIEFSMTGGRPDGSTFIKGALIVGYSDNTDTGNQLEYTDREQADMTTASPIGMFGPRSENFKLSDAKFYRYDIHNSAALSSCSHCWHDAATDSGARTLTLENNVYDTTVTLKARFETPFNAIFYDVDGTTTGKGANSWMFPYQKHNEWTASCEKLDNMKSNGASVNEGLVCDNTVQVRRIAFHGYDPSSFYMVAMHLSQWDADQATALNDQWQAANDAITLEEDRDANWAITGLNTWRNSATNYAQIAFKAKNDPANSWAVPFVTGHRYMIWWSTELLDWTTMKYDISEKWQPEDLNVRFFHPYGEVRAGGFPTSYTDALGVTQQIVLNNMKDTPEADWKSGDNLQDFPFDEELVPANPQELEFIVNGKDMANRKTITMHAWRCAQNVCLDGSVAVVEIETTTRNWSDSASWTATGLVAPLAGEDAVVEAGWNMIYDLEGDSPIFQMITINGRLSFKQESGFTADQNLRCKQLFIRAGELHIGSEATPFATKAQITLFGEYAERTVAYSNSIYAGNKLIANLGKAHLYGTVPTNEMVRLLAPAAIGATSITVDAGLSWVAGDKIFLAATSYKRDAADYATISAYDSVTGVITLTAALTHYHFGKATSTAALYNNILDVRGEVVLLTRNVRIVGDNTDLNGDWGGQMVTSDTLEADGTYRTGETILSGVEFQNCGQKQTYNAAIRFEGSVTQNQIVKHTVAHSSQGWNLNIVSSWNVDVQNSFFIGSKSIGASISKSKNIVFSNNFVGDVGLRDTVALGMAIDKWACVAICSYFEPDAGCDNIVANDNIAAGCKFAGFMAQGDSCAATGVAQTSNFERNVAHSIEGSGARAFPNPKIADQGTCYSFTNFGAYKCDEEGLVTHDNTNEIRASYLTFADCAAGFQIIIGGEIEKKEANVGPSVHVYGETEGDNDKCLDKYGMKLVQFGQGVKALHPTSASALPIHKLKSAGSWAGKTTFTDVYFHDFPQVAVTGCSDNSQHVVGLNSYSSDFVQFSTFSAVTIDNVHNDAFMYIYDSKAGWATIDDCGEFPCTAPNNIVVHFTAITCSGSAQPDFCTDHQGDATTGISVASKMRNSRTSYADTSFNGCTMQSNWNMFLCTGANWKSLGVLVFESLDSDTWDRSVQPVEIVMNEKDSTYRNMLNSAMDHVWDGFYTGQTRLSRFPFQIENDKDYTIKFTGTPPGSMRFLLSEGISGTGVFLRVVYAEAGAYEVSIKDTSGTKQIQEMTPWNTDIGRHAPLEKTQCGENRYVGVKNFMEFYITAGCEVTISPRKAVVANVRMEWTLTEFYDDGGTSKFADRIASALGIHASRIKVVAVYEGSVVVDYNVLSEDSADTVTQISQVTQLQTSLASLFTSGTGASILGAPILTSSVGVGGIDLINGAVTTSTSSTATTTLTRDTTVIGVGETMRAAFTAFAPFLYAMNKNPEVMKKLAEITKAEFLKEEEKADADSTEDNSTEGDTSFDFDIFDAAIDGQNQKGDLSTKNVTWEWNI